MPREGQMKAFAGIFCPLGCDICAVPRVRKYGVVYLRAFSTYELFVKPSNSRIATSVFVLFLFFVAAFVASAQPASLTVVSPNGGEGYELGEAITAIWTSSNVTTVRVEFTMNNGAFWQTVGTTAASNGSFTFTPSGFPTKRARVRVVDVDQPTINDASDGVFELLAPPSIMIFSPTTGELIMRGATYTIGWSVDRVARVNILFSTNAGATWGFIASNIDARLGQFVWTVPNQPSSLARIRIEEVGGETFAETGIFSIIEPMPSVRILRPNGGEQFFVGDVINVTWTAADVTTVTLSYSSNGGTTWTQFAGPMNASLGAFAWTSGLPPGTYRVRINAGGGIQDDGDGDFTIVRRPTPTITVMYPNGGEVLAVDSVVTIRWTSLDVSGPVRVEYSIDSGRTWKQAGAGSADVSAGALTWTVPNDTSSVALVRVVAPDAADTSDAVFAIVERVSTMLRVIDPDGGEHWREGDTITIRWISIGVANVDIQLSTDGGASWTRTIAQKVPAASGQYRWRVARLADTSLSSLLLRISASENAAVWDASNGTFYFDANLIAGSARDEDVASTSLRTLPNPFASSTTITWHQQRAASLELRVFDQSGALVASHSLGQRSAGENQFVIDFSARANGTYHYMLCSSDTCATGVMVKVR